MTTATAPNPTRAVLQDEEGGEPRSRFFRILHRVADRQNEAAAQTIRRFARELRGGASREEIVRALRRGDVEAAMAEVFENPEADRRLLRALEEELRAVFTGVGTAAADVLSDEAGVEAVFDLRRPRAVAWARNHAAELTTSFGLESREGLRHLVVEGLEDGLHPTRLAGQIKDSGVVGLSEKGSEAVTNFRRLLQEGDLEATRRRMTPSMRREVRRLIDAGPVSSEDIDRLTSRYSNSMLDFRARNNARTETIRAGNAGQHESWRQAVDDGQLPTTAVRTWITTPDDRTCPLCVPLSGETISIDDEDARFESGGFSVSYPPLHPQCRCAVGLRFPNRPGVI